jgi:drug/metabolite transporter (DMT)-like permease
MPPLTSASPKSVFLLQGMPTLPKPLAGALLGLVAASAWGANQVFAGLGVGAGLTPLDIAALRFGTAALLLAPVAFGGAFARVGLVRSLIIASLVGPLFFLLNVGGYGFAPLAHGALILPSTFIVAGILLAALMNGDRPSVARIAGAGVIVAGLGIVTVSGAAAPDQGSGPVWVGDLMFLAAGLLWAFATQLGPRWGLKPLDIAAVVAVLSALFLLPVWLVTGGPASVAAVAPSVLAGQMLVHGVLAGVIAIVAFTRSVQLLGPSRAAVFPALVPGIALLLGAFLTAALPHAAQLVGLAVVMAGATLALRTPARAQSGAVAPRQIKP